MCTNSREGNSDISKYLKILKINKGKNKILTFTLTPIDINYGLNKHKRKTHRTICDKSI